MREKLIQIYSDAKVPGDIEREIGKLRCENCKYWIEPHDGFPSFCYNVSMPFEDSQKECPPDFFCVLFEEKVA